jgi:hypothetical protein
MSSRTNGGKRRRHFYPNQVFLTPHLMGHGRGRISPQPPAYRLGNASIIMGRPIGLLYVKVLVALVPLVSSSSAFAIPQREAYPPSFLFFSSSSFSSSSSRSRRRTRRRSVVGSSTTSPSSSSQRQQSQQQQGDVATLAGAWGSSDTSKGRRDRCTPFIVGVAEGTSSDETCVVERIVDNLQDSSVAVLPQES